MKLDKAIEILTKMGTPDFEGYTEDIIDARKLGIEALKARQLYKNQYPHLPWPKLPGED